MSHKSLWAKLKKVKLGRLAQGVIHGVAPGSKADVLATRIGERVDQVNRVVARTRAEIERYAKENNVSIAEASDRLAQRALTGAEAGLAFQANKVPILLVLGGVVVLWFLLRKRA